MLKEMTDVARHSMHPQLVCIWNPVLNQRECLPPERAAARLEELARDHPDALGKPPIWQPFKVVFLTAAIGTVIFVGLCVTLTLLSTGEPPPARQELIRALFALAEIGFGAIVGLLAGKSL